MGDVALSVLVSRSETAAASRKRSRGEPEPRFHVIASRTDNATSPKCLGLLLLRLLFLDQVDHLLGGVDVEFLVDVLAVGAYGALR